MTTDTVTDRLALVVREARLLASSAQGERAAFYQRKAKLLEDLGAPDLAARARALADVEPDGAA